MAEVIHATDSEQVLIGAAMFDPAGCAEAFERVQPRHFHEPTHAALWEILRSGVALDPVLLRDKLGDHAGFKELGGISYLVDLVDKAPPARHAASYVESVLDAASRRAIAELAAEIGVQAREPGSSEALVAALERGCADIARDASHGPGAAPVGLTANDNLDAAMAGEFRGVPTGLSALDRVTGGIKRDDVWVFGGRSSMGKSIMGLSLARGVTEHMRGVLMFSLEMSIREVQARLIADIAHDPDRSFQVRYGDVLRGALDQDTRDRARNAARQLAAFPMLVNDRGGLTIDDIRQQGLRQVRAWEKAKVEPGLILIDHLGLIRPVRRTDSKAADTADTVDQLKDIAKQWGCPIVALAQVNRGPENRSDKRPTMGDLNWSGSIEQIADFVCLLYRQAYYDARSIEPEQQDRAHEHRHDLELLIQKNRAGPIGSRRAWVDVACNAVRDIPDERAGWAA